MEPSPDPHVPGMRATGTEKAAGALSLFAALVHGIVTPAHFDAWWGYGLFFLLVAAAQALFGIALLTRAINPKDFGPDWANAKRLVLWAGILGNLIVILIWAVSRTWGVPAGPEYGQPEDVGPLDLASKAAEAVLVGLLAVALRALPRRAKTGAG